MKTAHEQRLRQRIEALRDAELLAADECDEAGGPQCLIEAMDRRAYASLLTDALALPDGPEPLR